MSSAWNFRKPFNLKLRCNGVSSIEAVSLRGYSEVNENYYMFDVSSSKEKNRGNRI